MIILALCHSNIAYHKRKNCRSFPIVSISSIDTAEKWILSRTFHVVDNLIYCLLISRKGSIELADHSSLVEPHRSKF